MNKVNWKAKLSSRKFWALAAALGTSILGAIGASDDTAVKVTGIITAVGACAVYMLAEAYTDGKAAGSDDATSE
ncbi:hypothetical protein SAMN04487895_1277 [Paenibacillus sophorae]|uniref:Phage r1t holin n=1 Tax=Paenibacillus sophorae TaxID=1333845 RepID=A0A1H8VRB9_9BACL|nr:hypothetical protein [Paenibacillus sophorae]QWU15664.1 hypothetical protein KP014_28245 [Paenibacillus sophorae]SEP17874.1 hypothetical protein SAMN04487895_1277 [Paenibacillus sophorae]